MKRTKAQVSAVMQRVASKDTDPELRLRALLRCLRVRFSSHRSDLPGCPDFVVEQQGLAVFVDGDFWHGRQWKLRGLRSLSAQFRRCTNRAYWIQKIGRNVSRDRSNARQLRNLGWSVLRIWESDLRKRPEVCLRRLIRALEREK